MSPVYRYTITDRATALLRGGFREDEVASILMVEFTLDEFQIEDLPKLVMFINRQRKKTDASRATKSPTGDNHFSNRKLQSTTAPSSKDNGGGATETSQDHVCA